MRLIGAEAYHLAIFNQRLIEPFAAAINPTAAWNPLTRILVHIARIAYRRFLIETDTAVAPSAAEPTVANPAHFSRLRLLIPLSRADDFISSIAPYSFHMTCMSTRTRCSRWIIIFKGIAGASRAESLFALIVFVEFPPISLFAKI